MEENTVSSISAEPIESGNATEIATVETANSPEINTQTPSEETVNASVKSDIDNGEKFAKAFSQRLNKEREKLNKEYEPYRKVIERASKHFDMSPQDYIKSILEDNNENIEEVNTPNQLLSEKDELLNQLLQEKKEKEIADEWGKIANSLKTINPELTVEDIPDSVFEMAEKGIPLDMAYAHYLLTHDRDNFSKKLFSKEMEKLNKVNRTAGSLTSSKVETAPTNINNMSSKDFNDLKMKVLRGEIKSLT